MTSIQLKVAEAKQQRDVGRSIARLDSDTMKNLGVTVGDVVKITGKKETAAKVKKDLLSGEPNRPGWIVNI